MTTDKTNYNGMEFHPAANLFPLMAAAELAELAADIKEHGQREPIYTHEGKILDGRNRYLACQQVGMEPRFAAWNEIGSLIAFVISENTIRRHLTPTQKAVVGEEAEPFFAAEAKKRQANSTGGNRPQLRENIPEAGKGKAAEKAAKATGANPHYISDVKAIRKAAPELIPLMRDGKLGMQEGKLAAELPAADRAVLTTKLGGVVTSEQAATDSPAADNKPAVPKAKRRAAVRHARKERKPSRAKLAAQEREAEERPFRNVYHRVIFMVGGCQEGTSNASVVMAKIRKMYPDTSHFESKLDEAISYLTELRSCAGSAPEETA